MRKTIFTFLAIVFTVSIGYSQVTTLWEKSAGASTLPSWFDTGNLTRALAFGNDHVYIVSRNGGSFTFVYDAVTGDSIGVLDATGIAGGTYAVSDVEVSSDGIIFVCNLAVGGTFIVYRYDTEASTPVAVINYDATGKRLGDKFTVTGSTADNSIVIWAASANSNDLVKFTTADNGATFTSEVINVGLTGGSASVGPLANADFYYNAGGLNPQKFQSDGTLIGVVPGTVVATGSNAIRFLKTQDTDEYFATFAFGAGNENARIVKIPGGDPTLAELFGTTTTLGTNGNTNGAGDVAIEMVSDFVYNIYVLSCNNGFGAYQVDLRTPLAGDYYIPQGVNPQGFATLNDAVASLNINGATGTVNFLLDTDTLRENSFTFNADLTVDNNVVIKPAAGRDVTLIVSSSASVGNGPFMIGFNSGNVTFDGSNNGTDTRNLTVTTEQVAPIVDLPFTLNNANADNVTLKNLVIKNIFDGQTNFRYGAVINDLGGVMNFRVENCQIGTAERPVRRDGLAPWGGAATANQFSFLNNEIYCGTRGVATIYLVDSEIKGNTINILPTTAVNTNNYNHGIYITGSAGSLDIYENVINCLEKTNTSSYLIGIAFAGNNFDSTDIINVFNNMINVGAADETGSTYGIGLRSAGNMGNINAYHNTIVINNNASTLPSHAIGNHTNGTGPVTLDLKNNIIINNHSGNTGSSAIGLIPATSVLTSNYNVLFSNQNLVNYQGTTYADLAAWQATLQDANSVSKEVFFVSPLDLHLTGASNGDIDLAGTPIAGITTDIDGDLRDSNFPYKGADEADIPLGPITIAQAREDLNNDLIPDRLGEVVTIEGVVISPNYQTTNHSYYIWDGTAGITEILFATTDPVLNPGDLVRITGEIGQFRGLTQIQPAASTNITLLSIGNPLPDPVVLSLADYMAGPEAYEGTLLGFVTVSKVSGNWPSAGQSATIQITDGTDTVDFRIDSDTDLDDNPEPVWPVDVLGLGSQFSSGAAVLNDGYQILPRYYAVDILPPGTIPVELTSFTASAVNGNVTLSWTTASETNNHGFEIERGINSQFTTIGFVTGAGTSSEQHFYTFTDKQVVVGTHTYRLKQIDFDGSYSYSNTIEVDVTTPLTFNLSQNYPNPFNPTTRINYSVPFDSKVTISVYSITGEMVMELVNNNVSAGSYSVDFDGSNLASGMYIYKMTAGNFTQTNKMMLMK